MRKWKRGKERGRFVYCCGYTDLITLPLSKHQGNHSLLPQLTNITLPPHWPPPSLGRTSPQGTRGNSDGGTATEEEAATSAAVASTLPSWPGHW